jgi:flavin reductase (DIM6/NTAB) family NADH-FMN oxidoreductase RutF
MFYEPAKNDHGLKYNPYKSIVVPRPIGWITTLSRDGVVNLAPFSQFNNLGYDPPYVMFAAGARFDGRRKDSVVNATETGEFVCNMATWELREEVAMSSQLVEPDVDETELTGLETVPSRLVKPPRIAASPVHLECRFHSMMVLPGNTVDNMAYVVAGEVVGVHIRDDALTEDGRLDVERLRPLARMGYFDYTAVDKVFTMEPTGPHLEARKRGLGGEARGRPVRDEQPA